MYGHSPPASSGGAYSNRSSPVPSAEQGTVSLFVKLHVNVTPLFKCADDIEVLDSILFLCIKIRSVSNMCCFFRP